MLSIPTVEFSRMLTRPSWFSSLISLAFPHTISCPPFQSPKNIERVSFLSLGYFMHLCPCLYYPFCLHTIHLNPYPTLLFNLLMLHLKECPIQEALLDYYLPAYSKVWNEHTTHSFTISQSPLDCEFPERDLCSFLNPLGAFIVNIHIQFASNQSINQWIGVILSPETKLSQGWHLS